MCIKIFSNTLLKALYSTSQESVVTRLDRYSIDIVFCKRVHLVRVCLNIMHFMLVHCTLYNSSVHFWGQPPALYTSGLTKFLIARLISMHKWQTIFFLLKKIQVLNLMPIRFKYFPWGAGHRTNPKDLTKHNGIHLHHYIIWG